MKNVILSTTILGLREDKIIKKMIWTRQLLEHIKTTAEEQTLQQIQVWSLLNDLPAYRLTEIKVTHTYSI